MCHQITGYEQRAKKKALCQHQCLIDTNKATDRTKKNNNNKKTITMLSSFGSPFQMATSYHIYI